MAQQAETAARRVPLSRDRVLRAAVTLADEAGIDAVSMRKLSQVLGVVPMALYKHVANKEELVDGMVGVVVAEIDPPLPGDRLEDRGPGTDPVRATGAAAAPLGVSRHGVARGAHTGRAGATWIR